MLNSTLKECIRLLLIESNIRNIALDNCNNFFYVADEYVTKLINGQSTGKEYKSQLKELADKISYSGKAVKKLQLPGFEHYDNMNKLAASILKSTSFWNRPSLFGKDEFYNNVSLNLKRFKKELLKFLKSK